MTTGDCCGEFILFALYPMADIGEVGVEFDYDPVVETRWGEAVGAVNFLTEVFQARRQRSAPTSVAPRPAARDKVAWDVGVSRGLGDIATVDLRYYDSNTIPGPRC